MARIIHPHTGFTGSVGPVRFDNGAAETDLPGMVAYFDREGYGVHQEPSLEDEHHEQELERLLADETDPDEQDPDEPQE